MKRKISFLVSFVGVIVGSAISSKYFGGSELNLSECILISFVWTWAGDND